MNKISFYKFFMVHCVYSIFFYRGWGGGGAQIIAFFTCVRCEIHVAHLIGPSTNHECEIEKNRLGIVDHEGLISLNRSHINNKLFFLLTIK